ncbi:unnamed protein product, partial [Rotaria sordida]
MTQVRSWKRHILKIHYSKISQEYTEYNDSTVATNTCHSIYEEADIDSNGHTATDENIIFNHQDYATTNSSDPVPAYTNDLSHGNIQMLSKSEERLRLNILRLLINLKNNNATKTCIGICSRDPINLLNEYKDLDYVFNKKKQKQTLRIHQAQYIPFKESFINLLKKSEVYESLDCRSRSKTMTDLSTGSFCEQHNLFKIPDSLKIILFYDDLGINNPLGSRAKSVGMFYWTLANLPSKQALTLCMCYLKASIFYVYRDNLGFLILIEGICQRELKLLFKNIHQQKFSNLLSLASMIRNFQYGSKESSPSNTFNLSSEDKEVKFRASASEMLALFKYIPIIFYQARLIELLSTSLCWLSFLLLREIVSISFASEIDMMTSEKLEKLVTHYLLTFDNAYGYAQRIPKHHLLVRSGAQMSRFGPLRFTSCMVFEKKHTFFKRIKYRNFRNIAYTLADRHQHYIASLMYTCYNANTSSFLYSGHQIKKIKELDSTAAKQHHLLDPYKNLYETNQVTLLGITYTIGDGVLINDCVFPSNPVFGKILTIIVQDEIILFRLQLMQVIMFKQQLCLYELRLLDSSVTKNIYELKHKQHREIKVKKENTNDVEDMDTGIDEEEDSLTIENIIFADSGHKKCIVCRSDVHDGLIVMPKPARLDLLVLKRMYAPHGVRSCTEHLWNSRLLPDTEVNIDNRQTPISKLEPSVLLQLINDLLGLLQEASSTTRLDFMDPCLTDEDYLAWTGWNKQQFEDMFTLISPDIRTSFNRDAKNTLAMFWIKLKTNLSFRQIGSLFNIPGDGEHRRKVAARSFDSVRQVL